MKYLGIGIAVLGCALLALLVTRTMYGGAIHEIEAFLLILGGLLLFAIGKVEDAVRAAGEAITHTLARKFDSLEHAVRSTGRAASTADGDESDEAAEQDTGSCPNCTQRGPVGDWCRGPDCRGSYKFTADR